MSIDLDLICSKKTVNEQLLILFQYCTSSPLVSETTTTQNTAEHHEKMSTASSVSSTELDHYGRKVVWPCNNKINHQTSKNSNVTRSESIHQHKTSSTSALNGGASVDKPMAWMKHATGGGAEEEETIRDANEDMDLNIEKQRLVAAHTNRISRSRSRHIMERAKSFERAAAEAATGGTAGVVNATSGYNSNASSRPGSRAGSVSRNRRSPSVGRQLGIPPF